MKKYIYKVYIIIALFLIFLILWGWNNGGIPQILHLSVAFLVGWYVKKWSGYIKEVKTHADK